jgi:hypothetical protein
LGPGAVDSELDRTSLRIERMLCLSWSDSPSLACSRAMPSEPVPFGKGSIVEVCRMMVAPFANRGQAPYVPNSVSLKCDADRELSEQLLSPHTNTLQLHPRRYSKVAGEST